MKTSELSGMALCYAVCMIEMPHLVWGTTIGKHHASDQIVVPELPEDTCYSPFTSWQMFGPIIEREITKVFRNVGGTWSAMILKDVPIPPEDRGTSLALTRRAQWNGAGPTPLIAAMRCYVSAKIGDEVEIPNELQGVT